MIYGLNDESRQQCSNLLRYNKPIAEEVIKLYKESPKLGITKFREYATEYGFFAPMLVMKSVINEYIEKENE